jgi:hypothetical protein
MSSARLPNITPSIPVCVFKTNIIFPPEVKIGSLADRINRSILHSERLPSTLFDASSRISDIRVTSVSLTWQRLSSQTREGQEHETETFIASRVNSRILAPDFPVQTKEASTEVSDERFQKWFARAERARFSRVRRPRGRRNYVRNSIFKLDGHIY